MDLLQLLETMDIAYLHSVQKVSRVLSQKQYTHWFS